MKIVKHWELEDHYAKRCSLEELCEPRAEVPFRTLKEAERGHFRLYGSPGVEFEILVYKSVILAIRRLETSVKGTFISAWRTRKDGEDFFACRYLTRRRLFAQLNAYIEGQPPDIARVAQP